MDQESGEFQDWEMLDNSEDSGMVNSVADSVDTIHVLKGIGGDSEGVIRFDYFSLHSHTDNYVSRTVTGVVTDEGSVDSEKANSFDSLSETHVKDSGELPSDGSGDGRFSRLDCKNESGIVENNEPQLVHDVIEGIAAESESSGEFRSNPSETEPIRNEIGDLENATEKANPEKEIEVENSGEEMNENESVVIAEAMKQGSEEEKKRIVWWKLPLDLLRYCAIRVSPVWTMSMTAAVLGFVIIGRRLHMMKKKSRSLQLKMAVDDKQKASQLMSKAARFNEAFSVVKRVPVIRPSMPASGAMPWLVMNLR